MEIKRLHKNIYRLADYALFKKNVRPLVNDMKRLFGNGESPRNLGFPLKYIRRLRGSVKQFIIAMSVISKH